MILFTTIATLELDVSTGYPINPPTIFLLEGSPNLVTASTGLFSLAV